MTDMPDYDPDEPLDDTDWDQDEEEELPPAGRHRVVAATRIYDGSMVIGARIRRWIVWPWEQDHGFWPRVVRTVGRAGWVSFLVFALFKLADKHPGLWYLYVGSWILWSIRQRPDADPYDEDQEDEEPEETPPARVASPEETRAWIVPKIRALIGDSNGVHLDVLLGRLVAEDHLSSATRVTSFRKDLEANGIPVRDSVNIGNVTRVGIHRDDLGALAGGGAAPTVLTPPPPPGESPS